MKCNRVGLSIVVAALFVMLPTVVRADEPIPKPFSATYKVYRSGFEIGTTRHKFSQVGNGYLYDAKARPAGIALALGVDKAMEITRLQSRAGRLQPMSYRYSVEGEKQPRRLVNFDWGGMNATIIRPDKTRKVALQPETLTPLTMQLAVMMDLRAGRLKPVYTVIGNKRLEQYHVIQKEAETVMTGIGRLQAIVIEGSHTRHGKTQTMRLWCAPKLGYLPVKVEQLRDDMDYTIELASLDKLPDQN